MKKKTVWVIVGFVAVLFVVGILFATGVLQATLSSSFTPVYCNDPSSVCCVKTESSLVKTLGASTNYPCPSTANDCVVTNAKANGGYYANTVIYYGSQNCRIVSNIGTLWQKMYVCDDQVKTGVEGATNIIVPKGYIVWSDRPSIASFTIHGQKLVTNLGVPVLGSDSCTFNVSAGSKITNNNGGNLGTSYTVPVGSGVGTLDSCVLTWNSGSRHICGNLEEQCSGDADCGGHTYGNKECYQRTLQTYGCNELNVPAGIINVGGEFYQKDSVLGYRDVNAVASRCEIKSSVPVQCCGDTDCGSNAVCDKTTFTCKVTTTVQCRQDSDCGVSTQCDFTSKTVKTPKCSLGKCTYSTKAVGCCGDQNCASDEFCNINSVCEAKAEVLVACSSVFQCCYKDAGYVDKPCSNGLNCVAHTCQEKPECTEDSQCNAGYLCEDLKCVKADDKTCDSKFGGLVPASLETTQKCGFLSSCWFGVGKPSSTTSCEYDWTFFALIVGGIVLVLLAFTFNKGKGKNGRKKSFVQNKKFWLALGIIALAVILVIFWKFALAIFIGLLVVLILLRVLFGLSIGTLIRTGKKELR